MSMPAVLLFLSITAAGDITVGGDRPTTVFVPTSYDPQVPMPLVFLLQGYDATDPGYNGAAVEGTMRFKPLQEAEGYIYAHPDAARDACGTRAWDGTDACCRNFCGPPADDSGYLKGLINEIRSQLSVDSSQIYVVGVSAGGFMAHRMACDHADTLAAVASIAGATWNDPGRCHPPAPVHILELHGTLDVNVRFDGGVFTDKPYPDAASTVESWARLNGCSLDPPVEDPFDLLPGLRGEETRVLRYDQGCQPGGSAELWKVVGADHGNVIGPSSVTSSVLQWLFAHSKRPLPQAAFTTEPASGPAPLEVLVDASTSTAPEGSDLKTVWWRFEEGATALGFTARHTYEKPGRHLVILAVVTDDGRRSVYAKTQVTTSCPGGDTAPWRASDVGEPAFPGAARFEPGEEDATLQVCAGGRVLSAARTDQLFLVHQPWRGDFRLSARVSALEWMGTTQQLGLMARGGLEAGAPFAAILLRTAASQGGNRVATWFRLALEAIPSAVGNRSVEDLKVWLRLERRGNQLTGSVSTDGLAWEALPAVEVSLPEEALVGIAALGADPGAAAETFMPLQASLSDIELVPLQTEPAFHRGDPNSSGDIDISDGIAIFGFLFLGDPPSLSCKESADANNDGTIDISDGIYLLSWLFTGGPQPAAPGPTGAPCGFDPDPAGSPGDFGCESYGPCAVMPLRRA